MTTLEKTNKYYVFAGMAAFALCAVLVGTAAWEFFTYSVLQFLGFALVLWYVGCQQEEFFTKKNLLLLTAACLIVGVTSNLLLSQRINDNLFVFSEGDARFYHDLGMWFRELPLSFTFGYVWEYYSYEDWGGTVLIPLILRLVPSKIFLNAVYVLLGVVTAGLMFDTGKKMMNARYAFLATLAFSISSFMVFVYSSALKETFMVFLSVAAFYSYYRYRDNREVKHLVYALLWAALLVFFRAAVTVFFVASIGLTLLLSQNARNIKLYLIAFVLGIGAMVFGSELGGIQDRYMGADSDAYYSRLEYMSSESMGVGGSMVVSAVAALIGPFPAMLPKINAGGFSYMSLYGPGLLYRVMLALPFWLGGWFCLKKQVLGIYPLLLFPLLEMGALSLILEGLELRLQLAHMPMVFLLAFWMMYIVDSRQWVPNRLVKTLFNFWPVAVAMLAFLWTFR